MIIIVAKNIGFCFGVQRAIDKVEELLQQGCKQVYTLGELIHNRDVVAGLEKKGAVVIDTPEEAPEGAVVVTRAHGVTPDVLNRCKERGLKLFDATCPFVARIHGIVQGECNKGRKIVIVGNRAHPEVAGILARAPGGVIAAKPEDLPEELGDSVSVVAQTTITKLQFMQVVNAVNSKCKDVKVFDTICTTTTGRQDEAEKLAQKSDAVLVIGGKHSSNTQKLAGVCGKHCGNIYCIENAKECASILAKLQSHDIISIVAGASTPKCMILEVLTSMSELENTAIQAEEEAKVATPEAEVAAPEVDTDDFSVAFEKTLVRIRNGQILTGTVVQITDSDVCVNIGYKSDGFIPKAEFSALSEEEMVKVGDELDVEVIKVNDGEGNVLLSHKSVESKKAWERFIQAAKGESAVYDAIGKEVVKGGIIADIDGIRAFVPASQVSTRYVEKLDEYVGAPMRLMIIEVDDKKKRVVASQKKVLQAEAEAKKKEIWSTLTPGTKVMGTVRRLTDFGAFVDIGGVDGLIHVTEMAWGRVKHPSDVVSIGDHIEVLILSVDAEKERVSLSYKQLQPKPWTTAAERYPVGSIVEGKVVRIVPFGAFVSLEPTIDGLIHISQVATTRIAKVEDELKGGDIVRTKVLEVNPEAKRISLSRREVLIEEMPPIEDIIDDAEDESFQVEEEEKIELPPVESATTSLADLFPKLED